MAIDEKVDYSSFETKWIEFVGVADEFKMLRDKWNYLSSQPNSMLPEGGMVFRRMTKVIDELEELFGRLGFHRHTHEERNTFVEREISRTTVSEISNRFLELCHYHGILKTTFYMRTVSSEIPHVVSGIPLSPEKTMGNEAIYVAADNIARKYKNCLYVSDEFDWDGYVSFLYPTTTFYGASCRPAQYLRLFHISISEEGKNFLGLYLVIPHELAHMSHIKLDRRNGDTKWFQKMYDQLVPRIIIRRTEPAVDEEIEFPDFDLLLRQFVADLLGLEIGGITTLQLYNDLVYIMPEQYLRNCFLYGYYSSMNNPVSNLINAEIQILDQRKRFYEVSDLDWDSLRQIGIALGSRFRELAQDFVTDGNRNQLDLPSDETVGSDLISHLVKQRFEITPKEEEELSASLQSGKIVNNEDPAKILHSFYRNFRRNQPNNYNAAIFSLANSSF